MGTSLRDKSADLRRQHILEAATTVFALHGFHGATIRHVAIEAGVADGTIYKAFENKTALLVALLDPLSHQNQRLEQEFPQANPGEFVRGMLRDAWSRFTPDTLKAVRTVLSEALGNAEFRAIYLERVIAPPLSLLEPVITNLAAAKGFTQVDAPLLIRTLSSTTMGFVVLRLLGDPWVLEHWDELPEHLADLLLNGLLPGEADARA